MKVKYVISITIILLVSISISSASFAHQDDGQKLRDDRIYMSVKNESQNTRTVTFYFTSIDHTGHAHPWIGDQGTIICNLGNMAPGQSKVCHGPWHSQKSPDKKPECNPVSDWNFRFLISYEENGVNKNTPTQNGHITSVNSAQSLVSGFSWSAHTEQVFSDEDCKTNPVSEIALPPEPEILPDEVKIEEKEASCPAPIEIQEQQTAPNAPLTPRPTPSNAARTEITTDLDPDLSRPDKGGNDCAMIAVANNLNYFANRFGIPRGNGPGQLPADNEIVEELRQDMSWSASGVIDDNLINGKNNFTSRHGLTIRTTVIDFPTPQQIQDALANNKAVELSLKFRGTSLGHIVTPVSAGPSSITIHDPMTKGGKSQETYELQEAMDRTGKKLWLFGGYPNFNGYVIVERMFVQEYVDTQTRTSLNNQKSLLLPDWIKQNAKWWSDGITTDREFANSVGFLVKENVIKVSLPFNPDGTIMVSENLVIPSWIKNNAKWWTNGQIADSEFVGGIEYMIKEKIIDFNSENVEFEKAIKTLQSKMTIPSDSKMYLAKASPGMRIIEETNDKDSVSLTIPNQKGNYFGFYIDKMPDAKFGHPVSYAWVDVDSGKFAYVDAQWPPILELDGKPVDFESKDKIKIGEKKYNIETWAPREADEERKAPVYATSQKSLATGPAPKSIKGPSKTALVIDLGDNPPRESGRLDGAEDMFLETEEFKKYLESNGYKVDRVSQYWKNSYPYLNNSAHFIQLIEKYGKAFDCTEEGCKHEFFLYIGGHGSPAKYNSTTGELSFPGTASIYNPDGTGYNSVIWYDYLSNALSSFEPCVKRIFFLDACYSGSYIIDQREKLDAMCNESSCGMTVMTGSTGREVSWIGPNSSTKNFLKGKGVDNDGDGVSGDLRDMFEEMKKRNKQNTRSDEDTPFNANGVDSQMYICRNDQPLCSLDGPVTMIFDGTTSGVHVPPPKESFTQPQEQISVTSSAGQYTVEQGAQVCDEDPKDYTISAEWSLDGGKLDYTYSVTITDDEGSTSIVGDKMSISGGIGVGVEITNLDPGMYYLELKDIGGKTQVMIPEPTCEIVEPPITEPPITEPPVTELPGRDVVVLVIGGKYYPLSQFFDVPIHTPNCDSLHYHSEFPKVRSIDGVLISDPNPSTCGFGKVGLIPVDVVFMTQDQIDSFKSAMGIEP